MVIRYFLRQTALEALLAFYIPADNRREVENTSS
jgi:hypothetical protein